MNRSYLFAIFALIALLIGSQSFFIVGEHQKAIKFKFGEFERADYTPGIYPKIPWVNTVRIFDARILTLDAAPERYLTLEKKNVIVDAFIKWRISDVTAYYKTMRGDERQAGMRLFQVIKDGLRSEFGKRTIQEAISGERAEIMAIITSQIEETARQFGVEVVDVRIKRIELPAEVSSSVYQRMEAERARTAKDLRSKGAEAAERIRADADRQSAVIIAEAFRDSEQLRGEGDAKATAIYAEAYTRDPEFYRFYRSLSAYENSFASNKDVLVLDPSAEFFDFFKSAEGKR